MHSPTNPRRLIWGQLPGFLERTHFGFILVPFALVQYLVIISIPAKTKGWMMDTPECLLIMKRYTEVYNLSFVLGILVREV